MSTDLSLERAIQALRNGDRETARPLLHQFTQAEPLKPEGWLWLAAAHEDPTQKLACLQQVLALNPGDPRALAGLRALEQQGVVEASSALAASAQQQLIAETTAASQSTPTPGTPASRTSRLAQPRFATTGVRARRSIPWPVVALVGALVVLIPLALWLLGAPAAPQAFAESVTALMILNRGSVRLIVEHMVAPDAGPTR